MKRVAIRALLAFALVFVLCTACSRPERVPTPEASPMPALVPAIANETAIVPAPDAETNAGSATCEKPRVLSAETVAIRWPTLIGVRVRFAARVERAVDFTDAIVLGGGKRFIASMTPDAMWTGTQVHSYIVLGTTTVGLHGRTVLPHLLIADEDSCAP